MVALLRDNGDFVPQTVVRDADAFEKLAKSIEEKKEAAPALVKMLRENRARFVVKAS